MIVPATRAIVAGDEIRIPYVGPALAFEERITPLKKHLHSECNCELCSLDRADVNLSQRTKLDSSDRLDMLCDLVRRTSAQCLPPTPSTIRKIKVYNP